MLAVVLGYLIGSFPSAYVAGRLFKKADIRKLGDHNVGAANVFNQVGIAAAAAVFLVDVGKGAAVVFLAQAMTPSQSATMAAGAACVAGHNWPVYIGFKGGRGAATTLGVILALMPGVMLILMGAALIALIISRNTIVASAVLFAAMPVVGWWLKTPPLVIAYAVALACLVGITHLITSRRLRGTEAEGLSGGKLHRQG